MTNKSERLFHQVHPVCRECEREVRLERMGVTAEGQVEALGTCLGGHLVRMEMHFAELVAKAAAHERTGRGHNTITPFAELMPVSVG